MVNASGNQYDTDYFGWVQQQKKLLENRQFDELDLDNLIEEVEGMGKSEPRSLESHLVVLLQHLLKYQYQTYILNPHMPEPKVFRSWFGRIRNARDDAGKVLLANPSLKSRLDELYVSAYREGKKRAIREMNDYLPKQNWLTDDSYPESCPWSFEEIMTEEWLP
ncbi:MULTISPECIES: DUF29 domain-containing protein [unclassified Endozoicomonas]|uniref:DUF29 domain-containing protein n=1 Tax=unclassified Endozoicomonas TaxID=2644528 RepID=UPI00214878CE|nr:MULTISPECIES: DUF29 domain-containing protein [unclassified Endozoicomonas]